MRVPSTPLPNRNKPLGGTSEKPFQTSWIGNTHGGVNWLHIQENIFAAWVHPDGRVFCNTIWDEAHWEGGVYQNGAGVGNLIDTGWDEGGYAIAGDATYIYFAAHDLTLNKQGISRYNTTGYGGASFTGGTEHLFNFRADNSGGIVRGLTSNGTRLYASITASNVIEIYNCSDMTYVGNFAVTAPGAITIDGTRLWIETGGVVKAYTTAGVDLSITISTSSASALAMDANTGHLLVADSASTKLQVLIYDVSAAPSLLETIGVAGGIFASPAGQVGPLRFSEIVGVGTDSSGNLYVAQDHRTSETAGTGTNIESYAKIASVWTRNWQVLGLEFLDLADVDTSTMSGTVIDVYDADHHFKVDLSKAQGKQWTWAGQMFNRFTDTTDPRGGAGHDVAVEPRLVTLGGVKFLAVTGMYGGHMYFYKWDTAPSELNHLVLTVNLTGFGRVADNGDLWQAETGQLVKMAFTGLDGSNNPTYGAGSNIALPTPFTSIGRCRYDSVKDAMYIVGFTVARPTWGAMDKTMGTTMCRYNNWSTGNRTALWTAVLPYDTTGTVTLQNGFMGCDAFDVVGDRIYAVGLNLDGGNLGAGPRMWCWDALTGVQLANWAPEDPVTGTLSGYSQGDTIGPCGWVDMQDGINARVLPNGETIIFQEEDFQAKILMYRITR